MFCVVIGYSDSTRVLTLDEGEQASLTVQVLKPAAGQSGVQFTIMNGDNVGELSTREYICWLEYS